MTAGRANESGMIFEKRLNYIQNSYSANDASHLSHIFRLLQELATQGCEINWIIEKAATLPRSTDPRIKIIGLRTELPVLRHAELFILLSLLIVRGYRTSFVRIAAPASIVASCAHRIFGGSSFLWQSGTTNEHDRSKPFSLHKVKWWVASAFPNWLARHIVHRFVTGPEAMVDYYAEVVGVARDKIRLLYNDIDIERFAKRDRSDDRAALLSRYKAPLDTVLVLLVHRMSPVRRTLVYLKELLSELKEINQRPWLLIVAGGGSELDSAKLMAVQMGIDERCCFLGDVPNRDVPAVYAGSDIFINPSYAEGFPRVVLEAMAAGLPIVTTDAGGTRQLLGSCQQEFVTDYRNPFQFANKLRQLIGSRDKWSVLAAENRVMVRRFSTAEVARMYIRVIFG